MIIHCLFGQQEESYRMESLPELIDAIDEYCLENIPDYLDKAEQKARTRGDFISYKQIQIEINGNALYRLVNGTPKLQGSVKG